MWIDFNIEKFIDIRSSEKFESSISMMIFCLSVILDIDIEEIYKWDVDKVVFEYEKIRFLNTEPDKNINDIKVKGVDFKLIPFSYLTYGQFIDLEFYFTENWIENLHYIVSILWLRYEKIDDFTETIFEPYNKVDLHKKADIFKKEVMVNDIYGVYDLVSNFRKSVFEGYDFFNTDDEGEIDWDNLNDEQSEIVKEELEKLEVERKNTWMEILWVLSEGDMTKQKDILDSELYFVFNTLSYKIKKDRELGVIKNK
jgi:hypothetical protein